MTNYLYFDRASSSASIAVLVFIYCSTFEVSRMQFDLGATVSLLKDSMSSKNLKSLFDKPYFFMGIDYPDHNCGYLVLQ